MNCFRHRLIGLLLCIVLLCAVVGCAEEGDPVLYDENKAFPVQIENITLQQVPKSIIAMDPEVTDILIKLGFREALLAVGDEAGEEWSHLPKVGTPFQPDIEAIVQLNPDLLITSCPLRKIHLEQCSSMNIQVLVLDEINDDTADLLTLLYGNPVDPKSPTA